MRKFLQGLGALLALMGVSGAIDHLWAQPILGIVLNAFLGLSACGVVLVVAMEATSSPRRRV